MQSVFQRYEKKYLLTKEKYLALRELLDGHMVPDEFEKSRILNIYYDTPDRLLIRRSIEKPAFKEKLRLRSYGVPDADSTVFIEIKRKHEKIVSKRRIALPLKEAYAYLEQGERPKKESQILREIDFFKKRYPLTRSLFLAYDRIALCGAKDADFRVTFDTAIRSRERMMGLENGDRGTLLLPADRVLMETKVAGATPLWFTRILSALEIPAVSFSKYGNIFKRDALRWDVEAQYEKVLGTGTEAADERREAC